MSAHVAPHRWADLWAGRVSDAEKHAMERHAAKCQTCARTRERVTRASDSFQAIRDRKAPDMAWDAVRARVHWEVSTQKRAKVAPPRRLWPWLLVGGAAVTVAAGVVVVPRLLDRGEPHQDVAVVQPSAPEAPSLPSLVGLVTRATTDNLLVDGVHPGDIFAQRIVAGDQLVTGDGSVDVQFGDASAFALAPRSRLTLRRFDAKAIELVVEGTVDVQVGPRAADQRFLVIAGDRTVEVRGTQFRVQHDATGATVSCRHGLVAVRDQTHHLEVPAARRLDLHGTAEPHVVKLAPAELAALADATPLSLPLWDPAVFEHGSAPLEVTTPGRREVRVDGVELGEAPLRVRVMPGRHTVEVADASNRFRRAGWVDVAARKTARLDVPAEAPKPPVPSSPRTSERQKQFHAGLDRARLAACMRAATKQGLSSGVSVVVEIGVDAQGVKNFVNLDSEELAKGARECVKAVVDDVRFPPGSATTLHETIEF